MDDSDDDDDDLFADFEKDDDGDNYNVSANLIEDIGKDRVAAAAVESADEGKKIEWVAPKVSGLKNSNAVNTTVKHWYKDDDFKNVPDKNKPPPQMDKWVSQQSQQTARPTGGMALSSSVPADLAYMGTYGVPTASMPRVQSATNMDMPAAPSVSFGGLW